MSGQSDKARNTPWPQVGLGGGCYWCTEAVFQQLRGVQAVKPGFIGSDGEHQSLSEAVIVQFDPSIISLHDLIEVHLHTHSSTSNHQLRSRYRSAVYVYSQQQQTDALTALEVLQQDFEQPLVTDVFPFVRFEPSAEQYHNYYRNNSALPFCQTYISPKLQTLRNRFKRLVENCR